MEYLYEWRKTHTQVWVVNKNYAHRILMSRRVTVWSNFFKATNAHTEVSAEFSGKLDYFGVCSARFTRERRNIDRFKNLLFSRQIPCTSHKRHDVISIPTFAFVVVWSLLKKRPRITLERIILAPNSLAHSLQQVHQLWTMEKLHPYRIYASQIPLHVTTVALTEYFSNEFRDVSPILFN